MREPRLPLFAPLLQRIGGVLEPLVSKQLLDQLVPRVHRAQSVVAACGFTTLAFACVFATARQQHLALDLQQRRRHHQELAGQIDVEPLHALDVLEVLLRQLRHRDVVKVDLVLLDEEQQQVQGPAVVVEFYPVIFQGGRQGRILSRGSSRSTC